VTLCSAGCEVSRRSCVSPLRVGCPRDHLRSTALLWACASGHLDVVDVLLVRSCTSPPWAALDALLCFAFIAFTGRVKPTHSLHTTAQAGGGGTRRVYTLPYPTRDRNYGSNRGSTIADVQAPHSRGYKYGSAG
jgi:ankyrin repeat protein